MKKPLTIKTDNAVYHLIHLDDVLYRHLWEQSVEIHDESYHRLAMIGRDIERRGEQPLQFGQVYAALRHYCGHESSKLRDTWKMGFLFPFLLTGTWNQQGLLYLLRIANYRSWLEMTLRRLMAVDHSGTERCVVLQPLENELPREAINYICAWIYGFLEGYISTIPRSSIEPFYRCVDSNLIVFGYREGEFFEWDYEDPDEYDAAVQRLQQQSQSEK